MRTTFKIGGWLGVFCLALVVGWFAQAQESENYVVGPPTVVFSEPSAVIIGPDEAEPGRMVVLDASTSMGTGFSWEVDPVNSISPQHAVDSSGKLLYLATPTHNARYVIVLAVADNGEVAQTKHILIVGDDLNPDPIPNPEPNPIVGFAKQVYDWKIELVPADKRALCETLAKSHEAIASQIAAGALKTPEEILKATADSNKDAAGVANRDALLPFFMKLSAHLNAEQAKGGMKDLEKIRVMWLEIAQGLRRK